MVVPNVCHNNFQVIQRIVLLYGRIQLDPMFNLGKIYPPGYLPELRFDINPQHPNVQPGDARDLNMIADKSIRSMMLDPPWLITKGAAKMKDRYSALDTPMELTMLIQDILHEAYRVLHDNAILVFKCQDTIVNRRKYFMSLQVTNMAIVQGFNPIDELILIAPSRMRPANTMGEKTYGTHSHFSKFLVFRKKRTRTNYFTLKPSTTWIKSDRPLSKISLPTNGEMNAD